MSESILLHRQLFSLDAVKKTMYRFADRLSTSLEMDEDSNYVVRLEFDNELDEEQRRKLIADFNRELIDQDLRQRIFSETELTRNLILANAFSNAPLGLEEETE